ncbi:MAG: hypothetical protein HZA14_02580 [Nitrospirae bacterium]|nr:hypothetical protein [Nitrospirota bacterium]
MSDFMLDIGNGQSLVIKQGVGEIKAGLKHEDLSRISCYEGKDIGLHTGSLSPTLGRHGLPFAVKKD